MNKIKKSFKTYLRVADNEKRRIYTACEGCKQLPRL